MVIRRFVAIALLFSMPLLAQAAVETASAEDLKSNYILCRNQKTVRTIRVENNAEEKRCVALYTKSGVDKEVGRAQSMSSCMKIIENIKTNLEAASWKCKEVGNVNIQSTDEK